MSSVVVIERCKILFTNRSLPAAHAAGRARGLAIASDIVGGTVIKVEQASCSSLPVVASGGSRCAVERGGRARLA